MPSEAGYDQRTQAQAPAAMPLPSAASEGAAIGAGMAEAGEDVNAGELTAYRTMRQQQADQQAADFDHKFTGTRAWMDPVVQTLRGVPADELQGHTQNVMAALDTQKDALFAGITDKRVQQHAQQQWDAYSNSLQAGEFAWQSGQLVGKQVADFHRSSQISQNRIETNPNFSTYQQETVAGNAAIDAWQNVPANIKATAHDELNNGNATAFLRGTTNTNPSQTIDMLNKGLFDDVLKPGERQVLQSNAEVELRRQAALARQQTEVSKSAVTQAISQFEENNAAGKPNDPNAMVATIKAAQALGMGPQVTHIQNMAAEQQFAKIFNPQTPLQLNEALTELTALKNPTDDQYREIKWLKEKTPELTARFNADPVAFMANNGQTPPPPGPAREQWAETMGAATKQPPEKFLMSRAEADQLANFKNTGGQSGMDTALAALDHYTPGKYRAAAAAMVAPSDQHFQQFAQLDPDVRGSIEDGTAVLKGQPQFFGTKSTMPAVQTTLTTQDAQLREAMHLLSPSDIDTTVQQTHAHMVGTMTAKGITPAQTSSTLYLDSARRVLGGGTTASGQQVGGLGSWGAPLGMPGSHPVLLPNTINSLTFNNLTRGWLATHPPINGNGTPISIDTIWPAVVGPNTYKFIGADGQFVAGKNGKALVMGISGPVRNKPGQVH
jgi:hypothetical protein